MVFKELTERDLKKVHDLVTSKTTIVLLWAKWCIHCQVFKPVWNRVIEQIKKDPRMSDKLQLIGMESEVLGKLQKKNHELYKYITTTKTSAEAYFPKIMVFSKTEKGVKKSVYEKDRNESAFMKFVKSKVPKEKKTPRQGRPERRGHRVLTTEDMKDLQMLDYVKSRLGDTTQRDVSSLINDMMRKYMHI